MEVRSRIPEKLFFRIGEVCELIKVQPHVLRYWETEFPMLAPQKNRAGQRVYRRKDVEMVMRIRDLLYEEKFTIAGAKKKLMDEIRGGSPRSKTSPKETPAKETQADQPEQPMTAKPAEATEEAARPVETSPSQAIEPPVGSSVESPTPALPPRSQRAIRMIKRDLEELLTMLNTDASIRS